MSFTRSFVHSLVAGDLQRSRREASCPGGRAGARGAHGGDRADLQEQARGVGRLLLQPVPAPARPGPRGGVARGAACESAVCLVVACVRVRVRFSACVCGRTAYVFVWSFFASTLLLAGGPTYVVRSEKLTASASNAQVRKTETYIPSAVRSKRLTPLHYVHRNSWR